MGHVSRDTSRAVIDIDIDIDTVSGQILLAQRWAVRWHLEKGQPAWTQAEESNFYKPSDLAV